MNSLRHTRLHAAAALAFGAFGVASAAHADSDVVLSIGFQAPVYAQPAPGYFQQQPVYVQAAPIYSQQPSYVQSRPLYVQRDPVYSQPPVYVQRDRGYRYHDEEEQARRRAEWHQREWQQHQQWQQQPQQWQPRQQWQHLHAAPWVQGKVYEAGSIVQYGGRLYIAKMWNAGSLPTPNVWGWSDWTPYAS